MPIKEQTKKIKDKIAELSKYNEKGNEEKELFELNLEYFKYDSLDNVCFVEEIKVWEYIYENVVLCEDNETIERFLIARKMDVRDTLLLMLKSYYWRLGFDFGIGLENSLKSFVEFDINGIGSCLNGVDVDVDGERDGKEFIYDENMEKCWSFYGHDILDRPVYFVYVEYFDKNKRDLFSWQRYLLLQVESAINRMEVEANPRLHHSRKSHTDSEGDSGQVKINRITLVFDLKNFSVLKNMDYQLCQYLSSLLEYAYPERLGHAFVLNAPFFFYPCWKIIRHFLDPNTASKVEFVDNTSILNFLFEDPSEGQATYQDFLLARTRDKKKRMSLEEKDDNARIAHEELKGSPFLSRRPKHSLSKVEAKAKERWKRWKSKSLFSEKNQS